MKSDSERCAEFQKFKKIDAAFRAGDLAALRAAVDDPDSIPNGPMPLTIGSCLEYAIYHSPLPFIRMLLEIGADPNPEDHAGFPALDCGIVMHSAAVWIAWQTKRVGDFETAARLQGRPQSTWYQRLHATTHGCERTQSKGSRTPPASWRRPVPPYTNRRVRNASGDG
jgi:hypothetical protein